MGEVQEGAPCRQTAAKTSQGRRERERLEFKEWMAAYPLPIGEEAAWRAWQATRQRRPPLAETLATLEAQKSSARWREGTIPNPASYLRDGRWSDPVAALTAICADARTRRTETEARELQAGGVRAAPKAFEPAPILAALAAALPSVVPNREAYAGTIRGLSTLPLDSIEMELGTISDRLVDATLAASPEADDIEARARQSLAGLGGRLPAGAADRELATVRRRIAAKTFQLPTLSLWSAEGI